MLESKIVANSRRISKAQLLEKGWNFQKKHTSTVLINLNSLLKIKQKALRWFHKQIIWGINEPKNVL